MTTYTPTSSRCIALLDALLESHGPQGFGRIMQKLLAHCFRSQEYWVMNNPIGVPDFVAVRPGKVQGYAVEVKTATGRKLQLKDRELKAVRMSDHYPVVAVLMFPDMNPRWLCIDAHGLQSGALDTRSLMRFKVVAIDFNLDSEFRTVLAEFYEAAMTSTYALDHALHREAPTI